MGAKRNKIFKIKKAISSIEKDMIIDKWLQRKIDIGNAYIDGKLMVEIGKDFGITKGAVSDQIQTLLNWL